MKEKKKVDILLVFAVIVVSIGAASLIFSWIAKIAWGIDPPQGADLVSVGTLGGQLLAGTGIQIGKYFKKNGSSAELKEENAALKKQLREAAKEINKFRKAAGLDQMKLDNI